MSNEIPNLPSEKENNSLIDKYNHYENTATEEKAWGILTNEINILNNELNTPHPYMVKEEVRATKDTDSQEEKIKKVKERLELIVDALEQLEKKKNSNSL